MVSIIICSRENTISQELSVNIAETISCAYELIVIDNSKNNYSIFEAYNLGIDQSKGRYLCFMHDDIFIHSDGWGNTIHNIFSDDSQIGLIGVAGAKIKTEVPSAWWDCPEDQKVIHIIQHYPHQEKEMVKLGFGKEQYVEAVAIDGVFMAMRRDNRIRFNTKMTGFHNYDLNMSVEHKKHGYKIIVTHEILIEHFSLGILNKSWYESTSLFHKLYKNYLPLTINDQDIYINTKNGKFNLRLSFITILVEHKLYWEAIYWWFEILMLKPKSKYHYRFWKTILKNYLNFKNV
jgi:hypothetical protein